MSIYPPIPDTPTPTREAYNAAHFVGREEDLRAIRRKIEEGQAGYPITRPVIHLWGAPGIGKSWLLQHIYTEFSAKTEDSAKLHTRGILTALVDFTKLPFKAEDPSSVKALLQALQDGLQRGETPAPDDSEDKGAISVGHFIQDVIEWSQRFIIVLLFDSVEKLPPDDFFWLEREIIAPLARTDRVLFVIASRKELPRWKEFSVRQRLEVWELREFDLQTTQEQLTRYALPEEAAREIYPYTFGHPYANQVWSVAWQEGKPTAEQSLALLGQVERELLKDTVLERERDILRTLSAPRRFNVESARSLLGQVVDAEFGALSDGYYLHLFGALEQTNLVFWSSELRGYTISLPVRRILDLRIQMSDPKKFRQRHTFLREFYEGQAGKNQLDRGALLLEALYHLARETADETPDDRENRVQQFLQTYLTEEQLDTDNADTFLRLFRGDQEFWGEAAVLPPTLQGEVQEQVERLIPQDVYATSDRRS
ncbi:MAG TPA: ATP-binding protein [Anaerolineae bacterium]|nr:ATP-binding protein [Anaerolineae bacterium]